MKPTYPGGLSSDDLDQVRKHLKNAIHEAETGLAILNGEGGPVVQAGPTPPPPGPIPPN